MVVRNRSWRVQSVGRVTLKPGEQADVSGAEAIALYDGSDRLVTPVPAVNISGRQTVICGRGELGDKVSQLIAVHNFGEQSNSLVTVILDSRHAKYAPLFASSEYVDSVRFEDGVAGERNPSEQYWLSSGQCDDMESGDKPVSRAEHWCRRLGVELRRLDCYHVLPWEEKHIREMFGDGYGLLCPRSALRSKSMPQSIVTRLLGELKQRWLVSEGNENDDVGILETRQLMALVALAKAMISVDCGMLHIAGMFRIPTVAVMGPSGDWVVSAYKSVRAIVRTDCQHSPCRMNSRPDGYRAAPCGYPDGCLAHIDARRLIKCCQRLERQSW